MSRSPTPRSYLGFAVTLHDPALAIVDEAGELVFAEAWERPLQVKRAWHAIPDDVVRLPALLEQHCPRGGDLVVATSWSDTALRLSPWLVRSLLFMDGMRARLVPARPGDAAKAYVSRVLLHSMYRTQPPSGEAFFHLGLRAFESGRRVVKRGFDHHLTHAATAAATSGFESATCAIVDGFGEDGSTACYRFAAGRLERVDRGLSLGSLGMFYAQLCRACGFDPIEGEEWKVMGLSAYGTPRDEYERLLRPMLAVRGLRLSKGRDHDERLARLLALRDAFEDPAQAADLAATGQRVFEDVMAELLTNMHRAAPSRRLVLGGGCALNSAFNGRIVERTPFEEVHVHAAPGDDGNAVGAAALAWAQDHGGRQPALSGSPYLGSRMSRDTLLRAARVGGHQVEQLAEAALFERTARLLADGVIVGWGQGRAELGPRALDHRSILADARRADVQDVLNREVKLRERFRPFAPAILDEHGPDWFEGYQVSRYMERTLRFRRDRAERVPGVVHVDGTGRLQSVRREWSPAFHGLLSAFHALTGVPILLNTSFNVMGRPMVHAVEDALAVFASTGLGALVIEDHLFVKR
jgi:carbamoyltransferase